MYKNRNKSHEADNKQKILSVSRIYRGEAELRSTCDKTEKLS